MAAGFVATPLAGTGPLTVTFTDQSSGAVEGHVWDYGDGSIGTTSTLTHTHLYILPGIYTVTLTVSGLGGSDTLTRTGYITVTWPIISRVITYTYDDLYRLVDADYSTGEQFEYGYGCISVSRGRTLKFADTDMGQSQGVVGQISRQGTTTASEAHFGRGEGEGIQARPLASGDRPKGSARLC